MKFPPDILTRLEQGDNTVLDELVEVDEGPPKKIRECTFDEVAAAIG